MVSTHRDTGKHRRRPRSFAPAGSSVSIQGPRAAEIAAALERYERSSRLRPRRPRARGVLNESALEVAPGADFAARPVLGQRPRGGAPPDHVMVGRRAEAPAESTRPVFPVSSVRVGWISCIGTQPCCPRGSRLPW